MKNTITKPEKAAIVEKINRKMNKIAKGVLLTDRFTTVASGKLKDRITFLSIMAEINKDDQILNACQKWLKLLEDNK